MDIQPLDILKWMGLALAAGFIGYFGRYPAKLLIDKLRSRRKPAPEVALDGEDKSGQESLVKSQLKAEKKKAKQATKIAKKVDKQ